MLPVTLVLEPTDRDEVVAVAAVAPPARPSDAVANWPEAATENAVQFISQHKELREQ